MGKWSWRSRGKSSQSSESMRALRRFLKQHQQQSHLGPFVPLRPCRLTKISLNGTHFSFIRIYKISFVSNLYENLFFFSLAIFFSYFLSLLTSFTALDRLLALPFVVALLLSSLRLFLAWHLRRPNHRASCSLRAQSLEQHCSRK